MDVVRRLTENECEFLQGYPKDWTLIPDTEIDGKKVRCSSSARYKALGNSICLPQWWDLINRMDLPMGSTLGSLFDGIGGFPLVWEKKYGYHTAKWASEIELFPIAVTTYWFDDEKGKLYERIEER